MAIFKFWFECKMQKFWTMFSSFWFQACHSDSWAMWKKNAPNVAIARKMSSKSMCSELRCALGLLIVPQCRNQSIVSHRHTFTWPADEMSKSPGKSFLVNTLCCNFGRDLLDETCSHNHALIFGNPVRVQKGILTFGGWKFPTWGERRPLSAPSPAWRTFWNLRMLFWGKKQRQFHDFSCIDTKVSTIEQDNAEVKIWPKTDTGNATFIQNMNLANSFTHSFSKRPNTNSDKNSLPWFAHYPSVHSLVPITI